MGPRTVHQAQTRLETILKLVRGDLDMMFRLNIPTVKVSVTSLPKPGLLRFNTVESMEEAMPTTEPWR